MGQQILCHETILLPTPAGTTLAYSSPGGTSTDNFSAAPRLDVSNIQSAVQLYFKQGLATTTQKSHQTGQKRYLTFCSELMKPPLPTTEDILLMFVSYLAQQGLTHATIRVYLSAVRNLHVQAGIHEQFAKQLSPRLELVLKGIKRDKAKTASSPARLYLLR